MKKNLMYFLIVLLLLGTLIILSVPISKDLAIEKKVFEWVEGEQGQEYTLVIDGSVTKSILGQHAFFEGDVYIKEMSDPQLKDVHMQIKLKKHEIVNVLLTRAGMVDKTGESIAINETLGLASIQGIFDEMVIFPRKNESDSSIEISDKKFIAENLEKANELLSSLKSMDHWEIH